MTIIYNNDNLTSNQEIVRLHKVKGCEKLMIVRINGTAQLTVDSVSQCDPLHRPWNVITITGNQDICFRDFPCIACGQDLIFRAIAGTATNDQIFVQILDETCVPEPCCEKGC